MPVVHSHFSPPAFLQNGHLQTILPVLFPRHRAQRFVRRRLELEDGDFLDLDWALTGQTPAPRLAILSHGLEGCATNPYMRGMAAALNAQGFDVLGWNMRGCGPGPNRLLRFYHSGETGDLARVIAHARAAGPYASLVLVGFSLGGNLTLKYLGEPRVDPSIFAAMAVSAPIDLAACARALDLRPSNRLYRRRFMSSLTAKIREKAARFPYSLNLLDLAGVDTFQAFDDRFTAPIHGFRDAAHYWQVSSAKHYLGAIRVPTLLLSALNDPFLAPECFPFEEAQENPAFYLEAPASGGHVGFLNGAPGPWNWAERRARAFFSEHWKG